MSLKIYPMFDDKGITAITMAGSNLSANLARHVLEAGLSCSTTEVSELSLSILDSMDNDLQRSAILKSGTTLNYAGWSFAVNGYTASATDGGPVLNLNASSRYVQKLRAATGAKSWGTQDISSWVAARAREVYLVPIVQPGLGKQLFIRDKPSGSERPSTWDLMVEGAAVGGAWIFEHGNRLVMGRPTWLVSKAWGGRTWNYQWNGWDAMSDALARMPEFEVQDGEQTLTLSVVNGDRHLIRPGDKVVMGGSGNRIGSFYGIWLVEGVEIPLDPLAAAEVRCVRINDPDKAAPRTPEDKKSASTNAGSAGKGGGVRAPAATSSGRSTSSAVMSWARRVDGGSYDFDGSYGAQCVDLPKKYNAEVIRGNAFRGNGKDNARNAVRAGSYTWVSAGRTARVGDIVSWDGSWGGGYGHSGVVLSDKGSQLYCVHQMYGRTRIGNLSKRGLLGYARPKRLP